MRAQKLLRVAGEWRARPFEYGVADCCQFARHLVREMTGEDYGAEWTYGSEEEADRIIAHHGGLEGLISRYLGPPVERDKLRIGDLCLVNVPGAELMGARSGTGAFVVSSRGVMVVGESRIHRGWVLRDG